MSARRTDQKISVVMPVHNALPHLDAAVDSILEQTLQDFEFIIYDDASDDGSTERLRYWAGRDGRIKLFRGARNLGPAASSNEVVRYASAPLVARMDADDISKPERLQRQAQLFADHSNVGIVATLCDVIDAQGRLLRKPEPWRLARKSLFTPFPHGTMMFRRQLYDSLGGYRDECEFWEDLDFVIRASERTRILVIPEPLYRYRHSDTSTRIASEPERVENAIDLRYRSIALARQNRDYDHLLGSVDATTRERVDPRVFISLGSLALWSQRRPKLLRRFLKRARLRVDGKSALAVLWLSWASVSPGTLRSFLRLRSRILNERSAPLERVALEWAPTRYYEAKVAQDKSPEASQRA